ncbi:MAG TPA: hypothetical protein PLZ15_09235 [Melioribacteraceae bacterium]|nr:hypothetical protein [Melioribacteraceae bacterium]
MAAYFQMGHDTENLIGEKDLELFKGIILSPLNRTPKEIQDSVSLFRTKGEFDIVFDPQLYFPRSKRGKLKTHKYFPIDFETGDLNNRSWWNPIINQLSIYANFFDIDSFCSPVILSKSWRLDYYKLCAEIKDSLRNQIKKNNPLKKCYQTVLINVKDLTDEDKIMRTATVISASESDGFYVVFVNDLHPRKESRDQDTILGSMKFISELKSSNVPILVSHCSSDMILYKYAGAHHCASGKFFNLRRFTESRFDESSEGKGQLAYWFEHSLLGFLREIDLLRIQNSNLNIINNGLTKNFWSNKILDNFKSIDSKPWIKFGWRQYLSTFSSIEKAIDVDKNSVIKWIRDAKHNWNILKQIPIFLDEPKNDGSWLIAWEKAIVNFNNQL